MGKPAMKAYPAEFKERAVKLAVESAQPIAQTAQAPCRIFPIHVLWSLPPRGFSCHPEREGAGIHRTRCHSRRLRQGKSMTQSNDHLYFHRMAMLPRALARCC